MQDAEFEEKDFEAALYHQLARESPNVWSPGQVFEHHFGIDVALRTEHRFFMDALGKSHFSRRLFLNSLNWGYVWRSYGRKRGLPTFEVNALIQAKRPQHMLGRNSKIAKHGIVGGYWRFESVPHQQSLLERLSKKVGRRAVVSYACPAFHLWNELDKHIANDKLPDNCSYVTADRMTGHRHWCYQQPGGIGVACSEPEAVNEPSLPKKLSQLADNISNSESNIDNARESLMFLAKTVVSTVAEEAEAGSGLARAIQRRYTDTLAIADAPPEEVQFYQVALFAAMVNAIWFVVSNQSQPADA